MKSVYAIRDLSKRTALKILDALRLLSGMNPSEAPSQVVEEETSSWTGISERESAPHSKRKLSSNQHGRYGRH